MNVQGSTAEFLAQLRGLDITVRLENSSLRVGAPKNVLTPELRAQLASRKAEIINFLKETVEPAAAELPRIERVPRKGFLPLSFAQSRLWFLEQLMPGSTAYTLPMYSRLRGPLDVHALEKSVSELLRRHEILRTVFPVSDGTPSQKILPAPEKALVFLDFSALPLEEAEAKARDAAANEAKRPFDLARGPLLRAQLLRLGPDDHVLLFAVHHIVFDGWSIDVFWRDLSALYCAFREGKASPLAELPFQYVDFASWQKKSIEGPTRDAHLAYWKEQLGEHPPTLSLPTDRPRQNAMHSPGAKKAVQIGPSLCASLRSLSQREGASVSMTLLTAFNVLLHRLAGQDDILVGMPVACRSRAEFESMVGIFVNTMVVRTRLSESLSFRDVLHQVRDTMLEAHEHQDMPFEELVGALDPQRDLHRTPLFQVFFNYLNMQLAPSHIPGLHIEPFFDFEVESKFDFTFYLHEREKSISLLLVYNTNLFDDSRMSAMLEQYVGLLQQVCDAPNRLVWEYSLISEATDKHATLPDPSAALEKRWCGYIHSGFLEVANKEPARVAIADRDGTWTYGELAALSGGLSEKLRAMGVGRGDVVGVYADRSGPLVLALLGILRAGGAFCIFDPAYPDIRLANCARVAQPKAWVQLLSAGPLPDRLASVVSETAVKNRLLIPETLKEISNEIPACSTSSEWDDEDRPAYLTFTSGTTGEPKAVLGTHNPVSHFLHWHVRKFGLTRDDRFSMLSGLAHDPLLRDIFTPLSIGAALVIPSQEEILSPGRISEWMKQQLITVTHLTPAMGSLLSAPSGKRETTIALALRYAFFGGDVISSQDLEALKKFAPNVNCVTFYGATETPQVMAHCEPQTTSSPFHIPSAASRQIPIGKPIDDVQVLVLNRAGKLAGVGELGEINIRTPYLSQGYANDADLTALRFPRNPFTNNAEDRLYRTGDLGRYRPDGMTEIAGRGDQQVKIRGYRVELKEIELAIEKHPKIRDCAVVVEGSSLDDRKLVAYFVSEDQQATNIDQLRKELAEELADYQVPGEFHALSSLPITPNGKIDRRALASGKYRVSVQKACVQPRNSIEAKIAEVWRQVLGIENVGVLDDFFELGGHSLAATRLIAQIGLAFGIEIPLQALFLAPTVAGLAEYIQFDDATQTYRYTNSMPSWKCVVAAQPKGTRTPFFFVAGYQGPDDALLVLSRFVPHLGSDQPVFGLRPRWILGDGDKCASVKETAEEFISELRTIQPCGPYLLGGHCVGGVVAVEMARQLIAAGERVELLALLDTERPSRYRATLAEMRLTAKRVIHMAEVVSGILRSKGRERTKAIKQLIHRKIGSPQAAAHLPETDNSFYENKVSYRRLAYRHRIDEYPGRITLFVNDLQYRFDRYMGWKGIAKGGLVVHRIPGDHDTVLQTYGKNFAQVLLNCLDEARPDPVQLQARTAEVCS